MIDILENILKTNTVGFNLESYCILKIADKYNIFDYKDKIENLLAKVEILKKQGFLTKDIIPELTNKSTKLINEVEKVVNTKYDFEKLHKKLQDKLVELTGKKQVVIDKKYSFLLNFKDLETKLLKITKKYKLKDWNKIELLLLNYIDYCNKANWKYIKLLEYYIEKSGISQLATDYYNDRVEEKEIKQDLQPKDIKNLF